MKLRFAASTIQLLRFKFSLFLMPVFWFSLSQIEQINTTKAVLVFFILHALVYPASNGYNSYMDNDTESIGGVEHPLQPTKQLFYATIVLNILALLASLFIGLQFFVSILSYILASTAYSYRGIRLKKYPILGFFITIIFQGALVYFMVYNGASANAVLELPLVPMAASAFLIASFYPLTQIYQHKADAADGVKTISMLVGINGTFFLCGVMFFIAANLLAWYFFNNLSFDSFYLFFAGTLPVLFYFLWWILKVRKNNDAANFKNTMLMNIVASICTNAAFILILLKEKF
jgi:1,4-dihydroxy-2-naphthoate polyprenyltransferase